MLNVVALQGRVVQDLELKQTKSGIPVCSVRLAVERAYTRAAAQNGSPGSDFFDVIAWNKTAEFVSRNFSKGQMMLVSGHLSTREWEDKNGAKRVNVEIIADTVNFGGDRKKERGNGDAGGASYGYPAGDTFPGAAAGAGRFEAVDDVPF